MWYHLRMNKCVSGIFVSSPGAYKLVGDTVESDWEGYIELVLLKYLLEDFNVWNFNIWGKMVASHKGIN
jgi:hypothetical protein